MSHSLDSLGTPLDVRPQAPTFGEVLEEGFRRFRHGRLEFEYVTERWCAYFWTRLKVFDPDPSINLEYLDLADDCSLFAEPIGQGNRKTDPLCAEYWFPSFDYKTHRNDPTYKWIRKMVRDQGLVTIHYDEEQMDSFRVFFQNKEGHRVSKYAYLQPILDAIIEGYKQELIENYTQRIMNDEID